MAPFRSVASHGTIPENPLSHEWGTLCEDRSCEQNNASVGFVQYISKTCMNSFAKKTFSLSVIPVANDEAILQGWTGTTGWERLIRTRLIRSSTLFEVSL